MLFDSHNPDDFDFLCLTEKQVRALIDVATTERFTPHGAHIKVLLSKNLIYKNGNFYDPVYGVMEAYLAWVDRGAQSSRTVKHYSKNTGLPIEETTKNIPENFKKIKAKYLKGKSCHLNH